MQNQGVVQLLLPSLGLAAAGTGEDPSSQYKTWHWGTQDALHTQEAVVHQVLETATICQCCRFKHLNSLPLPVKQVLQSNEAFDISLVLCCGVCQRFRLPFPDGQWPFPPTLVLSVLLQTGMLHKFMTIGRFMHSKQAVTISAANSQCSGSTAFFGSRHTCEAVEAPSWPDTFKVKKARKQAGKLAI